MKKNGSIITRFQNSKRGKQLMARQEERGYDSSRCNVCDVPLGEAKQIFYNVVMCPDCGTNMVNHLGG